jgi:Reverse transcriptase (RNA-dependent DNA polymerase)/gag-polypeptide of LTR copia-type/Integrase core domain/GAG-pre-integrase domain
MGKQDPDKDRVPPLTGANFTQWVRRMGSLLIDKDLEDVVGFDPDTFEPLADPPTLTDSLRKQDRKAKAKIELRLDDTVLHLATKATSSHQLWKSLHSTFNRNSMAAVVASIKNLISCCKDDSMSVTQYIASMQTRALAVQNAGIKLDDKLIVAVMLANLPSSFSDVLTALDTLEEVSLEKATAMLLNAEIAQASISTETKVQGNAALELEVHALKAMVKKMSKSHQGESTCRVTSHRHAGGDDACWSVHPELRFANKQGARSFYTVHRACSASQIGHADRRFEIIADTGCSNHMFHDAAQFFKYRAVDGPEIALGDDSIIKAVGLGDARISINNQKFTVPDVLHVPDLTKSLFSLGQSESNGIKFLFHDGHMTIYGKDNFQPPKGIVMAKVPKSADNLYRMMPEHVAKLLIPAAADSMANFTNQQGAVSKRQWHQRLGHINERDLNTLIRSSAFGLKVSHKQPNTPDQPLCEPCVLAKMTRFPFRRVTPKTTHAGELIFSDLKGPFHVPGIDGGWRYFATYIDYHTRFMKVYLLKRKNDQLHAFKIFEATICNKFRTSIRNVEIFQTDNGGEYTSKECKEYFERQGIQHRTTVAYNPESNGIAERINRSIMEIAESSRIGANLPEEFWSVFVLHAVYLLNRRPHSSLFGKTPFEAWWGRKPDLSHLRVPGCDAYVLTPPAKRRVQDFHAVRGIFVGYAPAQKAYRVWNPETSKMMVSQHVLFNESSFTFGRVPTSPEIDQGRDAAHEQGFNMPGPPVPDDDLPVVLPNTSHQERFSPEAEITTRNYFQSLSDEDLDESDSDGDDNQDDSSQEHVVSDEQVADEQNNGVEPQVASEGPQRRSSRHRQPPGEWWKTFPETNAAVTKDVDQVVNDACSHIQLYTCTASRISGSRQQSNDGLPRPSLAGVMASDIDTDITLRQALNGPYGGHFSDAANQEFRNLLHFQTWRLRDLPAGRKAIGNKWVFKVKAKDDGTVDRFKARLVIQGFSQRPGIDYDETFAPVAHQESVRLLLALAAQHGYKLRHVDIVGAFLNGDMEEQVFMKQPVGFVETGNEGKVCELLKALYGLKQAGMVWNKRFNDFLTEKLGFKRVSADPCIYIARQGQKFIILGLHVDDALMVHNNDAFCDSMVKSISGEFETTDLGEPTKLLGMRLRRTSDGSVRIDQEAYTVELLKRFKMEECQPSSMPHQPGHHLSKSMCPQTPDEIEEMKDAPYGELVGGLLWLSINTRPDIKQAVSVLCRFVKNPGRQHWTAAKLVLRYLQGTKAFGVEYSKCNENWQLSGYADSDFANDPDKSRSVSAYVIMLANGPIAWKSKLQSSVATSSVHAEYVALYDAVREVVWFRQLLRELGHEEELPTIIHEDNKGCISLTANNRTDPRTKHINVKYHFTREQVKEKSVCIEYKPTAEMLADALTKPVNKPKFLWFRDHIGVRDFRNSDSDVRLRGRVESVPYEVENIPRANSASSDIAHSVDSPRTFQVIYEAAS